MNEESSLPVLPPSQVEGEEKPLAWEAIFDAIEDGICVQSLDSRIVRANRAFATIIGAPLEQVIGRTCAEVFGCANETGAIPKFCARVSSSETGCVAYEEISGRRPGQRLRSRVSLARDDSGKIVAYLLMVRDITETVAREREINRRQHTARFGELAASLAHEIKNPLAGIQGAVDILIQRRNPKDSERELLEGVGGEVGRIDAIVQSMLERAQPASFNFQPASVNGAIHRAVTLAGHYAATAASMGGRQIQVEFIADPSPIIMKIDAGQIEDAVHELLTNAIEAIDGHGSVIVRLIQSDGEGGRRREVAIEVKDNGRGIPEDLSRIFSPFFSTNPNGAGLGLPAVSRVARAHGGLVQVASTPGQGSVFTIRLPRDSR